MAVTKMLRQLCRLGLVLSWAMLAACATGTKSDTQYTDSSAAEPGALVLRAQALLAEMDYRPGVVDGVQGPRTADAVRAYQTAAGLEVDGRVSVSLVTRLEREKQTRLVTEAQERLAALGYDPGPADGKVGARTRAAVEAFQGAENLPRDGRVTARLLDQLAAARTTGPRPGSRTGASAGAVNKPAGIAVPDPRDLILAPGDRVLLSYLGRETKPTEVEIGLDGRVALPEAGSVQAAGLDLKQLRDQVTVRLIESYLGKLDVRVELIEDRDVVGAPEGAALDPRSRVVVSGDRLAVRFAAESESPDEFEVDPGGWIELPEAGNVRAAGLGLAELRDSITVKLLETYMSNLRVKIDLADAGESTPLPE
jgi:peptidoglycan hydrolase-like protein with peptidoglycan-binding domain